MHPVSPCYLVQARAWGSFYALEPRQKHVDAARFMPRILWKGTFENMHFQPIWSQNGRFLEHLDPKHLDPEHLFAIARRLQKTQVQIWTQNCSFTVKL